MNCPNSLREWLSALMLGLLPSLTAAETVSVNVTNDKGLPLHNAIVFLHSEALSKSSRPLEYAEVAQRNKTFVPEVAIVTQGTAVEFPNLDTVRHHVYSFSPAKTFELKLYIGKPKQPVLFDKLGVVELGCNIHDSMLGWVIVTDTPIYATTDATGHVKFDGLPADHYVIKAWHTDLPYGAGMVEHSLDLTQDVEINLVLETL